MASRVVPTTHGQTNKRVIMERYAMCYASYDNEDQYLYTDCHVFDTMAEAQECLAKHKAAVIEDVEEANGDGNYYTKEDTPRSYRVIDDSGRMAWTLHIVKV